MAPRVLINDRRRCGFTLIETLVALVLLSLVFLLLTGGLQFVREIDRKEAIGDADVSRSRTQTFLASVISQARPALVRDGQSATGESVAFAGSATRFELLTSAPNAIATGGLQNVSVVFDPTNEQVQILWGLYRPPGLTYEDKSILLDHVSNAEFAYFGELQKRIGWHDSWEHALSLPLLVRIRLSFSNGSPAWPDLIVSPKITSHRPVPLTDGTF
jgi:general secretion pathway protein J